MMQCLFEFMTILFCQSANLDMILEKQVLTFQIGVIFEHIHNYMLINKLEYDKVDSLS